MREITVLLAFMVTGLAASPTVFSAGLPQQCGRSGVCRPFSNCLPVMNDLKRSKLESVTFCDDDEKIVCCEQPNLTRISEKKCLEYMDYVFEKRYVPAENPDDDSELMKIPKCTQSSVPFVEGGNETNSHEFPHMALIGDDVTFVPTKWFCGGTLISPKFVLTAAHCLHKEIDQNNQEASIVRLGIHSISTPEASKVDVRVQRLIYHPQYTKSDIYNDIALLELVEEVKPNPYLRPACLPSPRDRILPLTLLATGWGALGYRDRQSDVLLKVDVPLVDRSTCQSKLESFVTNGIQDTQICYGGEEGKDACQGDSGGPLQSNSHHVYCSYTIYGVTSFGLECGKEGFPGIYTNVEKYLDWIERIVWPSDF